MLLKIKQGKRKEQLILCLSFNFEDTTWKDDMFEVEQLVKKLQGQNDEEEQATLISDNPIQSL